MLSSDMNRSCNVSVSLSCWPEKYTKSAWMPSGWSLILALSVAMVSLYMASRKQIYLEGLRKNPPGPDLDVKPVDVGIGVQTAYISTIFSIDLWQVQLLLAGLAIDERSELHPLTLDLAPPMFGVSLCCR